MTYTSHFSCIIKVNHCFLRGLKKNVLLMSPTLFGGNLEVRVICVDLVFAEYLSNQRRFLSFVKWLRFRNRLYHRVAWRISSYDTKNQTSMTSLTVTRPH